MKEEDLCRQLPPNLLGREESVRQAAEILRAQLDAAKLPHSGTAATTGYALAEPGATARTSGYALGAPGAETGTARSGDGAGSQRRGRWRHESDPDVRQRNDDENEAGV